MRYLQFLLISTICALLLMTSCKGEESGDIFQWDIYYNFIAQDSTDFFEDNPSYDPSLLSIKSFRFDNERIIDRTQLGNGIYAFSTNGAGGWDRNDFFVDFGNGDTDTLTVLVSLGSKADRSDYKYEFHYNGAWVDTWDFRGDYSFFMTVVRRNNPSPITKVYDNPVLVTLPKHKEPASN